MSNATLVMQEKQLCSSAPFSNYFSVLRYLKQVACSGLPKFFAVISLFLGAQLAVAQTTVTNVMQTGNFPTSFGDGGGFFNPDGARMGMYANFSAKQAVAWRTFKTAGDNTGSNRSLQVGDVFVITVSCTRAFGQIGFSLNAGGTQGGNYGNRISGSRLYVNTDNFGAWYVNRSGGASVLGAGYFPTENVYRDYRFTVRITSSNTADVFLTVDGIDYRAFNLTLNGSSSIDAFSVYGADMWDGSSNDDAFWKQTATVTNSGTVQLGYFLTSGIYTPGIISNGLDAASTSTTSVNNVFVGGDAGTFVILNQANTYTGSTTVNTNARLELQNAQALGNTSGLTVQNNSTLSLFNATGINYNSYPTTINGAGQSGANGAIRSTGGNNTWPGAITLGSSSRINADVSGAAGSLTLSGTVALGSNTLTVGGTTSGITISGNISGSGGGITKDGNNVLTLSGNNTYTGTTTVNAGTLISQRAGHTSTITASTIVTAFSPTPAPGIYAILPGALSGSQTFSATGLAANQRASFNPATSTVTVGSITPATTTLPAITTNYGTASTEQTVVITGTNLTGNITTSTAPTGFEVSSDGVTYGATASLPAAGGTLRVRLKANANVTGTNYDGQTITLTNGTATATVTTAASGNAVSAAPLTITGVAANDKTYDGTTTATLSGTPAYNGLQNGESFGVTGTPAANFNNASIGTDKPVTVTGYTAPNTNYTVSQPIGLTADIVAITESNAAFRTKISGVFSQVSTWEFDEGGNWVNASQVPTSNNNVTVLHDLTLDQDYTVGSGKSLLLGTGGTLTVNPTRTLAIAGAADFAGKSVTFKSTVAGTASLGQVTGSLTGASNVTVERYIRNNGFRSWRLLSVPVSGTQTIREAWQEGTANPLPLQNNLPNYGTVITGVGNQAAAQAAGFDDATQSAALLRWNGSGWTGVTSTNAAINNFSAYFLFIRGERSKGVAGSIANSSATTLRTTGTVFTGDVVNNVGANAFALIPNRYPSAINFTGLDRTGGVNNLFYIWDSKKQSGNSLGVYQTFSNTSSFNCLVSGGSYVLGQPNTTIESGQAFFVTSGAAGTITLKESAKINGTNGSLGFRPSATPAKIDSRLYSGDDMLDGNVVVFDAAYDRAVDGDDAPKMGNPGANFAIETQSKILAVEGTQQPVHNEAVQFRMWNLQQQAYKLEFAASNITMPGLSAELEDSYLNTSTAIDLRGTTTVNFTVDANEASQAANRFRIVFKQAAPLPITFISVSANRSTAGVKADWKVAAERAIRSYEVERSADGRNFTAVGSVTATGNNGGDLDYSFTDAGAPAGTLFYRIRSVGTAGDIKYSSVVKVAAGNVKAGYSISPNPVENGIVNLQFKNQPAGKYSVRVLSNEGKALLISTVTHAGGNSNQLLELPAGLARGTYQVEIIGEDRQRTVQTMLIK